MISNRHLSILSIIISFTALGLAYSAFHTSPAGQTAAALSAAPRKAFHQALRTAEAANPDEVIDYYSTTQAYTSYTHPSDGLSFIYQSDFSLQVFADEGGEVILATNPVYGMGFQIFIQPWNEPWPLTEARIRRDLPDVVMEDVLATELFHDPQTAMIRFSSRDPGIGELREAWFVRQGFLYQITFHAPSAEILDAWFRGFLQYLAFLTP